jgi:hypothetical protein
MQNAIYIFLTLNKSANSEPIAVVKTISGYSKKRWPQVIRRLVILGLYKMNSIVSGGGVGEVCVDGGGESTIPMP